MKKEIEKDEEGLTKYEHDRVFLRAHNGCNLDEEEVTKLCMEFLELEQKLEAAQKRVGELDFLRPEVLKFAIETEKRLRANDYKGGWQDMTPGELLHRLEQETRELKLLLPPGINPYRLTEKDKIEITEESADIANFAMFISDNYGGIGR